MRFVIRNYHVLGPEIYKRQNSLTYVLQIYGHLGFLEMFLNS
jgi:hypothetical protein